MTVKSIWTVLGFEHASTTSGGFVPPHVLNAIKVAPPKPVGAPQAPAPAPAPETKLADPALKAPAVNTARPYVVRLLDDSKPPITAATTKGSDWCGTVYRPVPYEVLATGKNYGGSRDAHVAVATHHRDALKLIASLRNTDKNVLANVDFKTHDVILVSAGQRGNPSYRLVVDAVLSMQKLVEVKAHIVRGGSSTIQVVVNPYTLIVVPKLALGANVTLNLNSVPVNAVIPPKATRKRGRYFITFTGDNTTGGKARFDAALEKIRAVDIYFKELKPYYELNGIVLVQANEAGIAKLKELLPDATVEEDRPVSAS